MCMYVCVYVCMCMCVCVCMCMCVWYRVGGWGWGWGWEGYGGGGGGKGILMVITCNIISNSPSCTIQWHQSNQGRWCYHCHPWQPSPAPRFYNASNSEEWQSQGAERFSFQSPEKRALTWMNMRNSMDSCGKGSLSRQALGNMFATNWAWNWGKN